jgi:hypothetical protein
MDAEDISVPSLPNRLISCSTPIGRQFWRDTICSKSIACILHAVYSNNSLVVVSKLRCEFPFSPQYWSSFAGPNTQKCLVGDQSTSYLSLSL